MRGVILPLPQYIFTVRCLIKQDVYDMIVKHKDKFTLQMSKGFVRHRKTITVGILGKP